MDQMKDAFESLKASAKKVWGEIPAEIQNEMDTIETLLNVPPAPPDENPAPSSAA